MESRAASVPRAGRTFPLSHWKLQSDGADAVRARVDRDELDEVGVERLRPRGGTTRRCCRCGTIPCVRAPPGRGACARRPAGSPGRASCSSAARRRRAEARGRRSRAGLASEIRCFDDRGGLRPGGDGHVERWSAASMYLARLTCEMSSASLLLSKPCADAVGGQVSLQGDARAGRAGRGGCFVFGPRQAAQAGLALPAAFACSALTSMS